MSSVAPHGGLASLYAAMLPPPPPLPAEPAIDIEAIADAAYDAGFAAGVAQAEVGLRPERALLAATTEALAAATVVDADGLRGVFVTLVSALVRTAVAVELRQNPDVMPRLVDTALAGIALRDALVVHLHPGDVDRVALDLPVHADPTLAPGTVSIDAPEFVIRDGLDARLAALVEALL